MALGHKFIISGHLHRLQSSYQTVRKNDKPFIVQSFVTGCLCDLIPCYSNDNDGQNWQHGFGVMNWDTTNDKVHIQNVLIDENYEAFFGEKIYKAD
jgi:hypothetical protein